MKQAPKDTKSGALYDFTSSLMEDAFGEIAHNIAVDLGLATGPYFRKIFICYQQYFVYEIIQDFKYKHSDQDVRNGTYKFKRGEFITLRADDDPTYFMPDRSNLRFVREVWK